MNDQYIQALVLIGSSGGCLDREIRSAIDGGKPLDLPLLREALAIESRSVGSRVVIRNLLAREIKRQETEGVTA